MTKYLRACMRRSFVCLTVLARREIIHIMFERRVAPVFQRALPHVRERILFSE